MAQRHNPRLNEDEIPLLINGKDLINGRLLNGMDILEGKPISRAYLPAEKNPILCPIDQSNGIPSLKQPEQNAAEDKEKAAK